MEPLEIDDPGQVGRYQLIARLGSNGMGRVYLARDTSGALFALNVIHQFLCDDPLFRQRFEAEVAAARQVRSSNTAALAAAEPDARPPWLAVEYIEGQKVSARISDGGPLRPAEAVQLAAGMAQALIDLHDAGLIHRDLKPTKVLLAEDGPRIIHFGIAQATGASVLTTVRTAADSAGYLAPEQAEAGQFTPAGDVFALGAVLCFAATGRRPFGGGSIASVAHRVAYGDPDLSGIGDHGLRELIADCLMKDPARRPTPREIRRRCPGLLDGSWRAGSKPELRPASALRPRAGKRLPEPRRQTAKAWLRPATAGALVLAAGLGAAVLGWGGGNQPSSAAAAAAPATSPTSSEPATVINDSPLSPVTDSTPTRSAAPTRSPKPRPTPSRTAAHPATPRTPAKKPKPSSAPEDGTDSRDGADSSAADDFWQFLLNLSTLYVNIP